VPPTGLAPVEANAEVDAIRSHSTSFTTGTRPVGSNQNELLISATTSAFACFVFLNFEFLISALRFFS